MKVSVSLPDDDLVTLDEYAHARGLPSRSAAVHHAIQLLRQSDLEQDYAAAWDEWEASGEEALWASVADDGFADAAR
ncbi:MAG TPA: ribbon-helix-helix domain-containing protein [Jatrophihabitantaceae bacterium]|nr:ribbon-helix-helix domain-containing protein [Jatrophihabitantaceae bacterium]